MKLKRLDYLRDNHSVYFSLADLWDFRAAGSLEDALVDVPDNDQARVAGKLFFRSGATVTISQNADQPTQDSIWGSLCDLISRTALPISQEAKSALFMRFRTPVTVKKAKKAKVKTTHISPQSGPLQAALLPEGQRYELVYMHRIPALVGTNDATNRISADFVRPSQNIELSRQREELTGNYETHTVDLTALVPSGTWEELLVAPEKESIGTKMGKTVTLLPMRIPLKVKKSAWYRLKTTWAWVFLLFTAFFLSNLVTFVREAEKVQPASTASPTPTPTAGPSILGLQGLNVGRILVFALAAGFAAFAVFMLQQRSGRR